jgi:hypothetical protein
MNSSEKNESFDSAGVVPMNIETGNLNETVDAIGRDSLSSQEQHGVKRPGGPLMREGAEKKSRLENRAFELVDPTELASDLKLYLLKLLGIHFPQLCVNGEFNRTANSDNELKSQRLGLSLLRQVFLDITEEYNPVLFTKDHNQDAEKFLHSIFLKFSNNNPLKALEISNLIKNPFLKIEFLHQVMVSLHHCGHHEKAKLLIDVIFQQIKEFGLIRSKEGSNSEPLDDTLPAREVEDLWGEIDTWLEPDQQIEIEKSGNIPIEFVINLRNSEIYRNIFASIHNLYPDLAEIKAREIYDLLFEESANTLKMFDHESAIMFCSYLFKILSPEEPLNMMDMIAAVYKLPLISGGYVADTVWEPELMEDVGRIFNHANDLTEVDRKKLKQKVSDFACICDSPERGSLTILTASGMSLLQTSQEDGEELLVEALTEFEIASEINDFFEAIDKNRSNLGRLSHSIKCFLFDKIQLYIQNQDDTYLFDTAIEEIFPYLRVLEDIDPAKTEQLIQSLLVDIYGNQNQADSEKINITYKIFKIYRPQNSEFLIYAIQQVIHFIENKPELFFQEAACKLLSLLVDLDPQSAFNTLERIVNKENTPSVQSALRFSLAAVAAKLAEIDLEKAEKLLTYLPASSQRAIPLIKMAKAASIANTKSLHLIKEAIECIDTDNESDWYYTINLFFEILHVAAAIDKDYCFKLIQQRLPAFVLHHDHDNNYKPLGFIQSLSEIIKKHFPDKILDCTTLIPLYTYNKLFLSICFEGIKTCSFDTIYQILAAHRDDQTREESLLLDIFDISVAHNPLLALESLKCAINEREKAIPLDEDMIQRHMESLVSLSKSLRKNGIILNPMQIENLLYSITRVGTYGYRQPTIENQLSFLKLLLTVKTSEGLILAKEISDAINHHFFGPEKTSRVRIKLLLELANILEDYGIKDAIIHDKG